jgi:hypothetical protein
MTTAHTLTPEAREDLAAYSIKTAYAGYRAHVRWLNAVEAHLTDGAQYPSLNLLPSKAAKHRMYDRAAHAIGVLYGFSSEQYEARPRDLVTMGEFFEEQRIAGRLKTREVPVLRRKRDATS